MKKWKHESVLKMIEESNNDPIEEIRFRARELVLEALENGWSGPPFNSIELANYLNLEITPNDAVVDARISPKGKKGFSIEYNPFQKPTRINFSVAHEIAHTLFTDCIDKIRNREDEPSENRELEQLCNIGASEIQLPYAIFSNDANAIENITLENLIALASKFKASLESLFIRFVEVIDRPCAIMICAFNDPSHLVVEYYKASKYFEKKIPSNFHIPNDSNAYECQAPGWSARETISWSFLEEEEYNIYCIGLSPMRKDNRGRVGIVVTPFDSTENLSTQKIRMEFGDATKPRGVGTKIIAQVVNSSGALGLGFGKSLSKNFPIVKEELQKWHKEKSEFILGNSRLIKVSEEMYIFQMLAQKGLFAKAGEIPLKYSSLKKCLSELATQAQDLDASIHMPMIGAGQAQGDWNVIQGMIHDEIVAKGIGVFIYMLPGKIPNIKVKSSLTLFNEESTWRKEK